MQGREVLLEWLVFLEVCVFSIEKEESFKEKKLHYIVFILNSRSKKEFHHTVLH